MSVETLGFSSSMRMTLPLMMKLIFLKCKLRRFMLFFFLEGSSRKRRVNKRNKKLKCDSLFDEDSSVSEISLQQSVYEREFSNLTENLS